MIDIVRPGFDAGIRYEETLTADMIAVPLGGRQRYALVASPQFLRAHGIPSVLEDLLKLPAIRYRFPSGRLDAWEFARDGQVIRIEPEARLICTNPHVTVRAAIDGVGMLLTFEEWVIQHTTTGALTSVLDDFLPRFDGPYLYFYSARQIPPPLRALIEFIRKRKASPSSA